MKSFARKPAATDPGIARSVGDVVRWGSGRHERVAALTRLMGQLGASAKAAGLRAVVAGQWLSDVVTDVAPNIVVRDAAQLRRQYPAQSDDAIAQRIVLTATRLSAAIGAAAGAMSAAEFMAPPTLSLAPVQLAAETVAVVAVELRMVAELHEIFGHAVAGEMRESAPAYLHAWVARRAVSAGSGAGLGGLLGDSAKRELRVRLLRRMGRSTTSLAPFLAGAAAGAEVNRRSTKDLGERLRAELRGMNRVHADIVVDRSGQTSVITSIEPA